MELIKMAKKKNKSKAVSQAAAEEVLAKESTDSQIPIESGDWVDNLKEGDLLYTAGYECDEEGNERVKIMTLKFVAYDKKAVVDKNTRIAELIPIIDGKEAKSVKLPNQNIRSGYSPTQLEAVDRFYKRLDAMTKVVKLARDRLEAEANTQKVKVN